MHGGYVFSILVVLVGFTDGRHTSNEYGEPSPNVLMFITDDLGYSDLSCFGNEMIKTPNIDKLAESGLKLTRMYATPSDAGSMAAILTGRHPLRMGLIKGWLGWQSFWSVAQPGGIPLYEMNIAKYIQMQQNSAFLFGRWNLGFQPWSIPTDQGFSGFYGTAMGHTPGCSSDADDKLSDWDYFLIMTRRQGTFFVAVTVLILTANIRSLLSRKFVLLFILILVAMIFTIRLYCRMLLLNRTTCKEFENQVVREEIYNDTNLIRKTTEKAQHYLRFRRTSPFLLLVSYHQPGHPAVTSPEFKGKSGINKYYDSLLEIDWSVGQVMATLNENMLNQSTIVFFLSDNGPVKTNPYTGLQVKHSSLMSNLRGEKGSLLEGGIRVPAIISWPKNIKSNQETAVVTSLMDIFPTVQQLIGKPNLIQKNHMRNFDGKNLNPLFRNPDMQPDGLHKALLHYCDTGDLAAASVGHLKVYFVSHNKSDDCTGERLSIPVVYNTTNDPGETTPLLAHYHQDVIARALSMAVKFEVSLETKKRDIKSQFDQIPFPWFL